jgi:hypothetical protein
MVWFTKHIDRNNIQGNNVSGSNISGIIILISEKHTHTEVVFKPLLFNPNHLSLFLGPGFHSVIKQYM